MSRIKSDVNRFRQIVRGKVREELRKHLGRQELIGRDGKLIREFSPRTQPYSVELLDGIRQALAN